MTSNNEVKLVPVLEVIEGATLRTVVRNYLLTILQTYGLLTDAVHCDCHY